MEGTTTGMDRFVRPSRVMISGRVLIPPATRVRLGERNRTTRISTRPCRRGRTPNRCTWRTRPPPRAKARGPKASLFRPPCTCRTVRRIEGPSRTPKAIRRARERRSGVHFAGFAGERRRAIGGRARRRIALRSRRFGFIVPRPLFSRKSRWRCSAFVTSPFSETVGGTKAWCVIASPRRSHRNTVSASALLWMPVFDAHRAESGKPAPRAPLAFRRRRGGGGHGSNSGQVTQSSRWSAS